MKSSDLRTGNYFSQFGNLHQVNGNIISELEKAPESQMWCKPIPLTDDWFEKLGFTFKTEELGVRFYEIQVGLDFLCFSKEGHWNINSGKSYWYMDRNFKSPKYVHELQNLYYVLTGKDLTAAP